MTSSRALRAPLIALVAAAVLATSLAPATACTRALYVAKDGTVIAGRSMDWGEDLKSNMWVLPRAMKRDGMGSKNSITWESKCGSPGSDAVRELARAREPLAISPHAGQPT